MTKKDIESIRKMFSNFDGLGFYNLSVASIIYRASKIYESDELFDVEKSYDLKNFLNIKEVANHSINLCNQDMFTLELSEKIFYVRDYVMIHENLEGNRFFFNTTLLEIVNMISKRFLAFRDEAVEINYFNLDQLFYRKQTDYKEGGAVDRMLYVLQRVLKASGNYNDHDPSLYGYNVYEQLVAYMIIEAIGRYTLVSEGMKYICDHCRDSIDFILTHLKDEIYRAAQRKAKELKVDEYIPEEDVEVLEEVPAPEFDTEKEKKERKRKKNKEAQERYKYSKMIKSDFEFIFANLDSMESIHRRYFKRCERKLEEDIRYLESLSKRTKWARSYAERMRKALDDNMKRNYAQLMSELKELNTYKRMTCLQIAEIGRYGTYDTLHCMAIKHNMHKAAFQLEKLKESYYVTGEKDYMNENWTIRGKKVPKKVKKQAAEYVTKISEDNKFHYALYQCKVRELMTEAK